MPYIKANRREPLDMLVMDFARVRDDYGMGEGELNYLFTRLLLEWVGRTRTYDLLSAARGILQDVSDEFYRRVVTPFEELKRWENGDVYARNPGDNQPASRPENPVA